VRVGVIQSSYVPWRGYFDLIDDVDRFVFYDDVQFSKGSWRNRNRIKTRRGLAWITVPVRHKQLAQRICDTEIDAASGWEARQLGQMHEAYAAAPFYREAIAFLEAALARKPRTISELNVSLVRELCAYLGIGTELVMSSAYPAQGAKTDRLLMLLKAAGATAYLSGPAAKDYLVESEFREAGIALEYKSYDYAPYPQQWGPFEGAVTVLDLIANCGPDSRRLVKSLTPNQPCSAA
jgi:hypothetical protein